MARTGPLGLLDLDILGKRAARNAGRITGGIADEIIHDATERVVEGVVESRLKREGGPLKRLTGEGSPGPLGLLGRLRARSP